MDKKTVLEFFHNLPKSESEQFNQAFALYKLSAGKNTATERMLNAGGYTKHNHSVLLYELQKLHGISDLEKRPPKVKPEAVTENNDSIIDQLGQALASLDDNESPKEEPAAPVAQSEPAPVQPAFREEYPFLKDLNCPDELKILAADKITFYNAYAEAHQKLQQATTGELTLTDDEKLELAQIAEDNFAKNEAIREEFDYYAAEGKILGKHPVFIRLQTDREVEAMTNKQLLSFVNSTKTFVSRKEAAIREAKSEDKKAELQSELDARLYKLSLVKTKLGISDK